MKAPNIYLVGFMGSGKTEVGRHLARLLARQFVDLDREIEAAAGLPVAGIFRQYGEARFRALESIQLERISAGEGSVVSTGGGAFCSAGNQALMKPGVTVWLDVPIEILYARCCEDPQSRPLFGGREQMAALLERRRPDYARANIHIQVGGEDVSEIACHIMKKIERIAHD